MKRKDNFFVPSVCCFCGCGCGVYLRVRDNRVRGVAPIRSHPVSRGNLCVKGWQLHEFIHNKDRLKRPLVRKGAKFKEASWDEAFKRAADGLMSVFKGYGSRAVGFLSSARCTNEENFLLQKFARAVFKTNNIDHCARL